MQGPMPEQRLLPRPVLPRDLPAPQRIQGVLGTLPRPVPAARLPAHGRPQVLAGGEDVP